MRPLTAKLDISCYFLADSRACVSLMKGIVMPRGVRGLSRTQLMGLARTGADSALKQLRAEITAIERTFPELAFSKQRRAVSQSLERTRKRTRRMSDAARKAVSERMKRYWA